MSTVWLCVWFHVPVACRGTYNALELAKRVGARLLLTSTSEVYGDPEVHPQPESYKGSVNCTGPRSCYDEVCDRSLACLWWAYVLLVAPHHTSVRTGFPATLIPGRVQLCHCVFLGP